MRLRGAYGGWLAIIDIIVKYFYCAIHNFDKELFKLILGECEGQQTMERLAILVAIRACIPTCDKRVQLCPVVRGDNVAALSMVINMRPKTENMGIFGARSFHA